MKELLSAALRDNSINEIKELFLKKQGESFVYGAADSQKHFCLAACYEAYQEKKAGPLVIVVSDNQQVKEWRASLLQFLPNELIVELPVVDMADFTSAASSMELMSRRMDILGRLIRKERVIILATANATVQKGMSRKDFERLSLTIELGEKLERDKLITKLLKLGYQRIEQVEIPGQFSVRGGIVDIYPINLLEPVRIEFFDIEIDSIRTFDLDTQRSIKKVSLVEIMPIGHDNSVDSSSKRGSKVEESFLAYIPKGTTVIFDEPLRIREQTIQLQRENPEMKNRLISWTGILSALAGHNTIFFAVMLHKVHDANPTVIVNVKARSAVSYNKQMNMFADDVAEWIRNKYNIVLLVSDKRKKDYMREFFGERRLASSFDFKNSTVYITEGNLENGFEFPEAKIAVITEKDIFGHQKKKLITTDKKDRISHFREIKVGDYVVHIEYGIGKYMGVHTLELDGIKEDYLQIKYAGTDKLYVPINQVNQLQKYIGAEGSVPELHKMRGSNWKRQVAKTRKAVEDIANELIDLYAQRKQAVGYAFGEDNDWQKEFEEAFPYEETEDQLTAISEIKADMEKATPMDRLLCGDVGFGKTEVAIRAAFKAVAGGIDTDGILQGKQVAVLVPTTVLAQQHYQTFVERLGNFNSVINVDVINRFRTTKEQKNIADDVASGKVDILIGTHSILNPKKIKFKNLGLLIVDEEQRFGVKQKEKIKKLANNIDVLTLSATPIPRTLHMSLVGTRDMSIIETAPADRIPVQSYVVEDSDSIITSAIRREIKRGGQIYFVHNRVENIEIFAKKLAELVPEARIGIGHGQMSESTLERVMMDFYAGKYDVLLATSIIENGLDLPNANTIIVHDADKLGLSQLYQMRGRVGRSNRMAYAYFLYHPDKVLTESAEKRLQAIKEFAELGGGFKIAMRDLEIRGAGNILGSQQHGHIASVGFEMYCRLLDKAMQKLKDGKDAIVISDPMIDLHIEAYLDSEYIEDPMHKIEIYQRIIRINNNKQIGELLDDLIDRFGEPPQVVINLLAVARIRNYACDLGIKSIIKKDNILEISFLSKEEQEFSGRTFKLENLQAIIARLNARVTRTEIFPKEGILRIKLKKEEGERILNFVTSFLKLLAGEISVKKGK